MSRVEPARALSVDPYYYKVIYPRFALGALVIVATTVAVFGVLNEAWSSLWALLVVFVLFLWPYIRLKQISMGLFDCVTDGGDYLQVRIDTVECRLLLSDIEYVTAMFYSEPPRIRLVLKSPRQFGRVVAFIPARYTANPFDPTGLFQELRERVRVANNHTAA